MKSNVLYSVVYNCSNGVSNKWRIKPFRLHLKENSGHVYQQVLLIVLLL